MNIHLFTSTTDKIGKTRCCISMLCYFIKNGIHTNIFDSNTKNSNLFRITTGKNHSDYFFSENDYIRGKLAVQNFLTRECFVFARKKPYKVYNGINQFWNLLLNVAMETRKQEIHNLVVETNFSFGNLIDDDVLNQLQEMFRQFHHNNIKLYIWNIWSVDEFITDDHVYSFDICNSVKQLEYNSDSFFLANRNFIHIFNLHNLYIKNRASLVFKKNEIFDISSVFSYDFGDVVDILRKFCLNLITNNEDALLQLLEITKPLHNIIILHDDKRNYHYIRERLIEIGSPIKEIYNTNQFGESTIWKTLSMISYS